MGDSSSRTRRTRLVLSGGLAAVSAAILALWTWYAASGSNTYCELEGGSDSEYGSLSWSLIPPGPKCTWTGSDGELITRYAPLYSVLIIVLIACVTLAIVTLRRAPVANPSAEHQTV